jgi:glycine/D-amino acid oxidase-like deaminating enzyme
VRTGELGHWWRSAGGARQRWAALTGPAEADVAIVGGGLTGLWSALYLKRARPELRVVVLEAEVVGFGASGRNGGWVSGFFSGPARAYDRRSGAGSHLRLQRAMFATVEEVRSVLAELAIDADLVPGGVLTVALDRAQLARLRSDVEQAHAEGLGADDVHELSVAELSARVAVAGACGAAFSPHAARVHPVKLLDGLARAVADLGVEIHEGTPVSEIRPHAALTPAGAVRAAWVVRATEGYTSTLSGLHRALVPMNSSMIVTEPLPPAAWEEIGWEGCEVMGDGAHVYVYLQRTADGRIAIGGRGVPYRYGSRTDGRGDTAPATVAGLRAKLASMFPAASAVPVAHAWSGVLGVPRDWCPSVAADPATGLARAGGYVGEGVAASNLAARMLVQMCIDGGGPLAELAWAGRAPRRWEPEPLRFAAIRGVYGLYRAADREEARSGRPSRLGRLVDRASGRA